MLRVAKGGILFKVYRGVTTRKATTPLAACLHAVGAREGSPAVPRCPMPLRKHPFAAAGPPTAAGAGRPIRARGSAPNRSPRARRRAGSRSLRIPCADGAPGVGDKSGASAFARTPESWPTPPGRPDRRRPRPSAAPVAHQIDGSVRLSAWRKCVGPLPRGRACRPNISEAAGAKMSVGAPRVPTSPPAEASQPAATQRHTPREAILACSGLHTARRRCRGRSLDAPGRPHRAGARACLLTVLRVRRPRDAPSPRPSRRADPFGGPRVGGRSRRDARPLRRVSGIQRAASAGTPAECSRPRAFCAHRSSPASLGRSGLYRRGLCVVAGTRQTRDPKIGARRLPPLPPRGVFWREPSECGAPCAPRPASGGSGGPRGRRVLCGRGGNG